jgi:hypothetical protein
MMNSNKTPPVNVKTAIGSTKANSTIESDPAPVKSSKQTGVVPLHPSFWLEATMPTSTSGRPQENRQDFRKISVGVRSHPVIFVRAPTLW